MRECRAAALASIAAANTKANLKRGSESPSVKVAQSGKVGRSASVAVTGTGFSGRTLDKVDAVKRATEDINPVVAETAKQALAEIDETGKVDGAFRKVAEVEREQIGGTEDATPFTT